MGLAARSTQTESAPPVPAPTGATIADATDAFLERCKQRNITESTMSKYRTFVKQLRAFCNYKGYTRLKQLTVTDMDAFYASWADRQRESKEAGTAARVRQIRPAAEVVEGTHR
jgi:site-specific recombinase XerD